MNGKQVASTLFAGDGCHRIACLSLICQTRLEPGQYEYRLRVDGDWTNDPQAEAYVPNTFGTENCVRLVKAA